MLKFLRTISMSGFVLLACSYCFAQTVTGSIVSVNPQCNNVNNTTMTGTFCNVAGSMTISMTGSGTDAFRHTTWTVLTLNAANGGGSYTASGTTMWGIYGGTTESNTNQAYFDSTMYVNGSYTGYSKLEYDTSSAFSNAHQLDLKSASFSIAN